MNPGIDIGALLPPKTPDERVAMLKSMKGHLAAWDPVNQREAWRVQHATTWNGGVLSTAGNLVFQGRSDGVFAAYAADTGETKWEMPVHTGIVAAPVSYAIDGEQYIAVVANWGGSFTLFSGVPRHRGNVLTEGRILAFKLGGEAKLPDPAITYVNIPEPPVIEATAEEIERGELLYHTWCTRLSRRRRDLGQFLAGSQVPARRGPLAVGPHRAPRRLRDGGHARLRPCTERVGFECDPRLCRERSQGGDRVLPIGVSPNATPSFSPRRVRRASSLATDSKGDSALAFLSRSELDGWTKFHGDDPMTRVAAIGLGILAFLVGTTASATEDEPDYGPYLSPSFDNPKLSPDGQRVAVRRVAHDRPFVEIYNVATSESLGTFITEEGIGIGNHLWGDNQTLLIPSAPRRRVLDGRPSRAATGCTTTSRRAKTKGFSRTSCGGRCLPVACSAGRAFMRFPTTSSAMHSTTTPTTYW